MGRPSNPSDSTLLSIDPDLIEKSCFDATPLGGIRLEGRFRRLRLIKGVDPWQLGNLWGLPFDGSQL